MAKISKKDATKFLTRVPEEYVFRCNDGCVMNDMKELAQAFNYMSDQTFAYHANETKNDFSNWVADIIGDQELASTLKKATDRTQAAKYVADRVTFLSKRAGLKS